MKSLSAEPASSTTSLQPVPELLAATAESLPDQAHALARARAFAEPLLAAETLDTGENTLAHADAVASILKSIGGSEAMQAASYLVYACDHLNKPHDVIAKAFGDNFAALALETTKLVRVQRQARQAQVTNARASVAIPMAQTAAAQTENVRKMLLAFSRDLRVVMLRLASRLQTLRYFARRGGARGAAGVCAAGQPAGHPGDQVGDGRSGLSFSGAGNLPRGGAPAG
jgi:GTP pyrophosphokinase